MKITANPEAKGTPAIRASIVEQCIQTMLNDGVSVSNAQKMEALLGTTAPLLRLTTPAVHLVSVTAYAASAPDAAERLMLDNVTGYLNPAPGAATTEADVPDADADQHLYILGIERLGEVTAEGASRFWSYSLLLPETLGARLLCIALDLGFDGEIYKFSHRRRIYLLEDGGDRFATLRLPANIYNIALDAAIAGGCPITSARVNRSTRQELGAARQARAYNTASVAPRETVPAEPAAFRDPFSVVA